MKMDTIKMKKELQKRLEHDNRSIIYNREKETLRIENKQTGKGITVSLSNAVSKWHEKRKKQSMKLFIM